jgi:cyclic pyranopterin phosphate synthase
MGCVKFPLLHVALEIMMEFTHLDENNRPKMVDVTAKKPTLREAVAIGRVLMRPDTVIAIESGGVSKGDAYATARIAGIMAAKKTSDIIPMCHPLEITGIDLDFSSNIEKGEITIKARTKTFNRTGVEMEAMTAVSVAALTIYDMCKSADRAIVLSDIKLLEKSGGKSGTFVREE